MSEAKRELVKRALSSLSDETRFRIVKSLLEEGSASAGELATKLDKARSTVDEHLEELLETGLVARRRVDRKFLYEATELAKLCVEMLEGKGSMERLLEALPDQVKVEVEVVEAIRGPSLKWLASNPALTASAIVAAALAIKPLAPWLDLRAALVIIGLGYGIADVKGVLRVERRDLAAACVAAALLTAAAACLAVTGHNPVEVFIVGFVVYLAWYAASAFIPFEALRLLWRR